MERSGQIQLRAKLARAGTRPPGKDDDGPITLLTFEAELSGNQLAQLHPHIGAEVEVVVIPYAVQLPLRLGRGDESPGGDLFTGNTTEATAGNAAG